MTRTTRKNNELRRAYYSRDPRSIDNHPSNSLSFDEHVDQALALANEVNTD